MKTIELQIYWKDPNEPDYSELGIKGLGSGLRLTRPVNFVVAHIEGCNPFEKDGKVYGVVMCSSQGWITTMSYVDLKRLIDNL